MSFSDIAGGCFKPKNKQKESTECSAFAHKTDKMSNNAVAVMVHLGASQTQYSKYSQMHKYKLATAANL